MNCTIEDCYGGRFDYDNPVFDIVDMSYALSNLIRFAGRSRQRYSIAEHSWLVSMLTRGDQLEALLHDGPEAVTNDIPSPFKQKLPDYRGQEDFLWERLSQQYDLAKELSEDTHRADMEALILEADAIMPSRGRDWDFYDDYRYILDAAKLFPFPVVQCYPPHIAQQMFLARYTELTGNVVTPPLQHLSPR